MRLTSPTRLPPDIQSQEVGPGEDVVSTYHHPDVRHKDVLQGQKLPLAHISDCSLWLLVGFSAREPTDLNAADDGGGEGRVVLRGQHDGVHQNKAAEQKDIQFGR